MLRNCHARAHFVPYSRLCCLVIISDCRSSRDTGITHNHIIIDLCTFNCGTKAILIIIVTTTVITD